MQIVANIAGYRVFGQLLALSSHEVKKGEWAIQSTKSWQPFQTKNERVDSGFFFCKFQFNKSNVLLTTGKDRERKKQKETDKNGSAHV